MLPFPNTPGQSQGEAQTTYNNELRAGLAFYSEMRELRLRRSAEGSRDTHIVRGFTMEITDTDTLTGQSTTTHQGMTLDLPPGLEESTAAVVLDAKTTTPNTARHVNVTDYEIKPHPDMYNNDGTGKLGDLLPSVNSSSKVKHFVTPRKTDEIPDEWVLLVADGLGVADFQPGPNGEAANYTWSGGVAGDADNQRKVSRAAANRVPVKIISANGGEVELIVWVVWCETSIAQTFTIGTSVANDPQIGPVTTVQGGIRHKHTIQPDKIIKDTEKPKLDGPRKSAPPGKNHPLLNLPLSGGVNMKWDASRQFRFKHSNPNGLPAHAFSQPAPRISR
jgi:hypothetical protein